ncbi:MAG: cyclic nucleotide-binding domain-containing protein [Acidobacteriota bacterium]
MSIDELLSDWDLFSHFTEAQRNQLAPCISRSEFAADSSIVIQGDSSAESFIIESGTVNIQRSTPYGVFSFAKLYPGDLFGESAFVDQQPRSSDAITTTEASILILNPSALNWLLERDQRFSVALYWTFWKSLSGKLRDTNEILTRFFSESGKPPSTNDPLRDPAASDFRLDLGDKRKVFEEQKLSNLEINFLAPLSKEIKLAPGEQIFREGEPGDIAYVVLDGRVMISKYIPGAGEEALAFLERGDYFGEMALIDKMPRSADAKAHAGGAVILAIPADVLEGILDIQKVSSLRLLRILCTMVAQRLRELDDKIAGWFVLAGGRTVDDED